MRMHGDLPEQARGKATYHFVDESQLSNAVLLEDKI